MKDTAEDFMPLRQYESLAELEDYYWWHQGKLKAAVSILRSHLKQPTNLMHYMDIGCGTGGFMKGLANKFAFQEVIGIDGSKTGCEFAGRHGLTVKQVDFEKSFLISDKPYDLITATDVLEHIDNEDNFLKMVHLHLNKNGLFFVSVPAYNFLFSSWDEVAGHKRRYDKRRLSGLLKTNGFSLLKITYFFSYILPVAIARRFLGQKYSTANCEFPLLPEPLNLILLHFTNIESQAIRFINIPFGLSIMCLAQK